MSVGLMIITHNHIGEDLLNTARSMMGTIPLETYCLAVSQSGDPDILLGKAIDAYHRLHQGDGVLVLTDMYGSTPSNIANRLTQQPKVQVIAGLNLPMLVRVLNYPTLRLHELVNKAISGGHDGILLCETHS
ncbi:PTS fructose transporter subunit IIA [Ectothiorhodospira haloalkaliphila]|uniref:PTS fructose transporter subunit IIA n=1 Tax=Ectothiorhodospira haloalkaliphila TaxID=421628 RepID=W8KGD3_9GAMM|nr:MULTISPECIES: PTS sugar transporter subunit IIA [Ectothiorhodospira]AHK78218.1 PTS fructose transporter subunit IIA [Ectothiorhodospira haloalkaliphila]MCG5493442.1 PTS sugar transporter subunit IIA [Ectothiorhodospira variabilis]MCG5496788.1 PTS sugar transporter subunit IIA [Ectothiorhodospira variabilis]MCG5502771.1 PTS sugar transporter subunit IIA [Ectothiorhodospira variabilis]MCG5505463.1 PTS sugar transporter subunit IIA [Ectothiorhodospira variabilis]